MKSKLHLCFGLVPIITILAGSISIQAQDGNGLVNVRLINVKAESLNDWIDLQRRSKDALEKVGGHGRSVWQQIRGDNYIFHIVEDHENWASLDSSPNRGMEAGELALWGRDLRNSLRARQVITYRSFDDLEIKAPEGSTPKLLALRKITVKAGQAGAYRTWLREKLVPALRKAGASGRSFGQVAMGGDLNQFYVAIRHDSWASLDEPGVLNKLSQGERDAVFDGYNDMIEESTMVMLSYRADLSYKGPDE
jgi:hypothetical protein